MPALTGWHLVYFVCTTYFFAGSFAGAGVIGAGVAAFGITSSVLSIIFESGVPNEPSKLKLESNINKINMPPKVQVLLSKKSVVFCTPPTFRVLNHYNYN